jgi:hypothetical protein
MSHKKCKKCGIVKDMSSFWKCSNMKDGHQNTCIECAKERKRAYYQENREEIIRKTTEYKKNNLEWDKETRRKYYEANKEEFIKRLRQWELNNKERRRESIKKNREKNPEVFIARQRRYIKNNKEKCLELGRKHTSSRRARMKKLVADFTEEQWKACLVEFDNKCAYCGKESDDLHQEHVIPVSKDGDYTVSNIVPACKRCNTSKLNRNMETWYKEQKYFSAERLDKIQAYIKALKVKVKG